MPHSVGDSTYEGRSCKGTGTEPGVCRMRRKAMPLCSLRTQAYTTQTRTQAPSRLPRIDHVPPTQFFTPPEDSPSHPCLYTTPLPRAPLPTPLCIRPGSPLTTSAHSRLSLPSACHLNACMGHCVRKRLPVRPVGYGSHCGWPGLGHLTHVPLRTQRTRSTSVGDFSTLKGDQSHTFHHFLRYLRQETGRTMVFTDYARL
jgi:hypothetical protein